MGKGKNYSSSYPSYGSKNYSSSYSSPSGKKSSSYGGGSSYQSSYSSPSSSYSSYSSYSSPPSGGGGGGGSGGGGGGSRYANKPVVYSLNLDGGKKYVGKTNNFEARMNQHFSGNGAKWTQQHKPVSINHAQVCRSNETASKAETIVYRNMSNYHGKSQVRGAGHTKTT